MIIYLPIFGALAFATLTLMEKIILGKKKINSQTFVSATFLATIIVMLPFIYFFWKLDAQAFELKNLFIFFLIIISSLTANLLLFFAIKWEKITTLEPAIILEPLFTILLALVFSFIFGTILFQRNFNVIFPAIIASLALVFSHIKKHHLDFNKYFLAAIGASFFFALELVLTKLILDYYTPISFYFLRCLSIFIVAFFLFRPKLSAINTKIKWQIFVTGALWVFYRVMVYYGYIQLGVIFTTLLLLLGPVFVYAFARIFLKEKLDKRNILAAIVIIACVLYAILA